MRTIISVLCVGLFVLGKVAIANSDVQESLDEARSVQKAGFQNGDVVKSIDGQTVNDPSQAFEMMGNLKKSNRVEVVRDGHEQDVNYEQNAAARETPSENR